MFSRSTQMARGVSRRGAAALNSVRVHVHEVVESTSWFCVYQVPKVPFACITLLLLLMELQNSLSVI